MKSCQDRWRTERILLRRFVNEDHAALARAIFAEADVMKTLIGDASTADKQLALAAEWIARWNHTWDAHGYGVWAVEIADPALGRVGELIGFSGFEAPVLATEAGPELIAGRASAYWSQGISTELGHAVVRHLFAMTDVPSVHALVFYEINPAAVRMMDKLGFTAQGEVPIHARVGPGYQQQSLAFELARVGLARPERVREVLESAAFKVGQLLGCRAAHAESLFSALASDGQRAAWQTGFDDPLPAADYRELGTAWLDREVERRQRQLTSADPTVAIRAAHALARVAAAVARDLAVATETLIGNARARGLDAQDLRATIEARVAEGLAHPSMLLFRRDRPQQADVHP